MGRREPGLFNGNGGAGLPKSLEDSGNLERVPHQDGVGYQTQAARLIDGQTPDKWTTCSIRDGRSSPLRVQKDSHSGLREGRCNKPSLGTLRRFQKRRALQVQQPWEGYDPLIAFFAWLNRLYYCGFLLRLGLLNGYDFPASGVPSDLSWFLWGTLRGHV